MKSTTTPSPQSIPPPPLPPRPTSRIRPDGHQADQLPTVHGPSNSVHSTDHLKSSPQPLASASSSSLEFKATPPKLLSPIQEARPPVRFPDKIPIESNSSHSIDHSSPSDHPSPLEHHSRLDSDSSRSRSETPTSQGFRRRADSLPEPSFAPNSTREDRSPTPIGCKTHPIDHLEAIAELEELEVNEFLRRSSKYLQEIDVQSSEPDYAPPPIPKLDDFRSTVSRKIDWVGFGDAYAAAQLERYCPSGLITSSDKAPVSITQLKSHASRCYATILPEFWRILSSNSTSSIYRWQKPSRTAAYVSVYYLLWLVDLLPSFIVAYALYLLIDRQLNPPTVSQLKREASQRHQLGQEAEAIESDGLFGIKPGLTGSVAKGVLGNPMLFAGIAIGAPVPSSGHPPPNPVQPLPDMSNYRGMYAFGRWLYAEHGHQIQNVLADLADLGEKIRNLYLWRRPHACWRTTFMLIGMLAYTLCISQKWLVKNFLGWLGIEFFFILGFTEKHPKFRRILNPIWVLLYGIPTDSEFVLDILQQRGRNNQPYHIKAFKKTHKNRATYKSSTSTCLLSAKTSIHYPSDQSSLNSCSQSRRESVSSDKSSLRGILEVDTWKRLGNKLTNGSTAAYKHAKKVYEGDSEQVAHQTRSPDPKLLVDPNSRDLDQPQTSAQQPPLPDKSQDSDPCAIMKTEASPILLKTFATLNAKLPGSLIVTQAGVCFEPFKGFRTKLSNLKPSLLRQESLPLRRRTSSSTSSLLLLIKPRPKLVPGGQMMNADDCDSDGFPNADLDSITPTDGCNLVIPFSDIIKIKKVKKSLILGVGLRISDGIELHLENSTVLSFDHIINRDEYFHQFLLICGTYKNSHPDHK